MDTEITILLSEKPTKIITITYKIGKENSPLNVVTYFVKKVLFNVGPSLDFE
jgi:hypothetical protein